jgi:hypothetical protein
MVRCGKKMEMKECIIGDRIIISPLEVRHYLLDLPPLKEAFRKEAVVYALRTLYPGTPESTVFDYCCVREKTVGIAVPSGRLEKYRSYNKPLVSPSLVIGQSEKNAVTVCAAESWIELQVVRQGVLSVLFCAGLSDMAEDDIIARTLADKAYADLPVHVYTLPDAPVQRIIHQYERCRNAEIKPFGSMLTPSVVSKSVVFREVKNSPAAAKILAVSAILLAAGILGIFDFQLYRKAERSAENLQAVKKEYEKSREAALVYGPAQAAPEFNVPVHLPLAVILHEISGAAAGIRLDSFTVNGDSFKFEAENAQALPVLENLKKSEFLENVTLYQAVPLENGGERFIISGKIKDE